MKKEISPEMYNYNKFPGPKFISFDNIVKSDDYTFTLLENEKEAFDTTAFEQRFTEILLKYDYIVGDWGNEQLRLKGFYKDSNDIKKTNRISRLEDYIKEFCNFGCAYFVLENPNPNEIKFEEDKPIRRKKSARPQKRRNKGEDVFTIHSKSKSKSSKEKYQEPPKKSRRRKDFQKVSDNKQEGKKRQSPAPKNDHFIIRKKDNNS